MCPSHLPGRNSPQALAPEESGGRWEGAAPAALVPPVTFPSQVPQRKRRFHADYRELLAFESQGRKLNAPGSAASRLLLGQGNSGNRNQMADSPSDERHSNGFTVSADSSVEFGCANFGTEERRAIVVLDQRMNMFFGTQRNMKSVVAVNAAALLAWQIYAQEKALAAVVFNDTETVQFSPGASRLHTLLILQNMLNQNHNLQPDARIRSNPGMFNEALGVVNTRTIANSLIYLITDGTGCDADTSRLVTNISRQNDVVVILVYDPQQTDLFGVPGSSGERECGVRADGSPLSGKIQRMADQLRAAMSRLFPEGTPLIPLDTRHDIARQLRRAFADPIFPPLVRSGSAPAPVAAGH